MRTGAEDFLNLTHGHSPGWHTVALDRGHLRDLLIGA